MRKPKAVFCWSGGKDSAYGLHRVLTEDQMEVCYLLTTLNDEFNRVSMHGTREALLDQQATSIGLPLLKVKVSSGSNAEYEEKMNAVLLKVKSEGIEYVIFGDIFLEDLRTYRENNLHQVGLKGVFPLWKTNTRDLIADFLTCGFKTIICCVNDRYLGEEWLGREIDASFLRALPPSTDACGENGEYHTFCYAGPIFSKKIGFIKGEHVYKKLALAMADDTIVTKTKGFWFCDLLQE